MGFERQFGSRKLSEWVRERRNRSVYAAAKSRESVGGGLGERLLALDENTNATSCLRTSKVPN